LTAATVATLGQAAFNSDFLQGFQTGAFLGSAQEFDDYSCPEPESSAKMDNFLNMYNMGKQMMGLGGSSHKKGGKKGKKHEVEEEEGIEGLFNKIDKYMDQITIIASVLDDEYDGGDFCAGLTIAYEGR